MWICYTFEAYFLEARIGDTSLDEDAAHRDRPDYRVGDLGIKCTAS